MRSSAKMLTDLLQLRTFVTVAEEHHLTRAADRLGMSPAAASAHIRAIEDRLGIKLFVRANRKLLLTQAGALLSERAANLLKEERLFVSVARTLNGEVEGSLVIGTSSEPGTRVGELLAHLRVERPLISVDVVARPSTGVEQGLLTGEFDLGILLGQTIEPGFSYREMSRVRYRIAGPAAWRDAIEKADWAMLADQPWLTPSWSSAYSAMLGEMFGSRGLTLNSVVQYDNSSVGRAILKAGVGLMLLREDQALEAEHSGYVALSPLALAETSLRVAHRSIRSEDPLICAVLNGVDKIWPPRRCRP